MLIEFSVKNFRSIREKQTFSMVASKSRGGNKLESNAFTSPFSDKISLLKSAVAYGANAAGKSSLILALDFMQKSVIFSVDKQFGESTESQPFLFDDHSSAEESEFEIIFVAKGIRYQYGFACNKERYTEEWLIAYPKGKPQTWFERCYDPKTDEYNYHYSDLFKGSKKTWESNTLENTLFFSRAVQLNSKQLQKPFNWFNETLLVVGHNESISIEYTGESCCNANQKSKILQFFKKIDLPIADIIIEEKEIDLDNLPSTLLQAIKEDLGDDFKNFEKIKKKKFVKIIHKNKNSDKEYSIPLKEESHGTKKLFEYASPFMETLVNGKILVIDELNNSLHPNLVYGLLNMIHSNEANTANGQLIFTTHDTSLLDLKKFRRDQIWLVEKDDDTEATELLSLADFKDIRSNEALAKGYLSGRYGAVPYIEEL